MTKVWFQEWSKLPCRPPWATSWNHHWPLWEEQHANQIATVQISVIIWQYILWCMENGRASAEWTCRFSKVCLSQYFQYTTTVQRKSHTYGGMTLTSTTSGIPPQSLSLRPDPGYPFLDNSKSSHNSVTLTPGSPCDPTWCLSLGKPLTAQATK